MSRGQELTDTIAAMRALERRAFYLQRTARRSAAAGEAEAAATAQAEAEALQRVADRLRKETFRAGGKAQAAHFSV